MKENQVNQRKLWKSIEHRQDEARFNELAEQEFMSSPLRSEEGDDGVARRDFLKLMGASLAMSATACVRRPVQKIVPYAKRPEDLTIGVANYYASSMSDGLSGYGLIVKTREGRPIKLEPNPENPASPKGISARAQALCVSLYDPDRLKQPKRRIAKGDFHKRIWDEKSWDKIDDELIKLIESESMVLLTNNNSSPSKKALIKDFSKAFKMKSYSWNPLVDSAASEAQAESYGSAVSPRYRFDKAKFILNVGSNFLATDANSQEYATAYAKSRKLDTGMSRHVCFESLLTLTGMNSDDRIRVRSSQYVDVLMGLAHEIVVKQGNSRYANNSSVKSQLEAYANTAANLGVDAELFSAIAKDLWANRGQSIVITGDVSATTANAKSAHIAANFLNSILDNDGKTVDHSVAPHVGVSAKQADLKAFISELQSGKHKLAIIENVNAAYYASASKFTEAVRAFRDQGGTVVYFGQYHDETADLADMILPNDHILESWGDSEFHEGVYSVQQPTIRPLHKTRSLEQSMLNWAYMAERGVSRLQNSETYHDYVKSFWKSDILKGRKQGKAFEDFWFELLQKAVYGETDKFDRNASARSFRTAALSNVKAQRNNSYELELYTKSGIGDGTYANISWLQEFPDPVSKVTWDNYLTVSKATADKFSLKEEDMVRLTANGKTMELPVYVQVGQHDDVFGLALGYGRTKGGKVANGVGFDAYPFVSYDQDGNPIFAGIEAKIEKIAKTYKLANTQGHNHMLGRQIVIGATLDSYKKDPSAGIHKHKIFSAWSKFEYPGHKWAMSVDLNSCIGCGDCVVACQAENNIPVVGKKYVLEGREMHWMRIDRYYSGSMDNPDSQWMPVMCQHCDNAPCETVCPVVATTHSEEGINEMTYNRCVGTRYCSNNCPYKVRRFNWFAYTKGDRAEDTPKEAYNPRVTVRSRGVMEKCTFCIQRIKDAKDVAKNEGRSVRDGEFQVACEQGCSSGAIVFGDMNDKESRVSKAFADARTYSLLEEYNAVPSVRYMTKIRNAKREDEQHGGDH